jgi:predicted nucleic acid-binding protein
MNYLMDTCVLSEFTRRVPEEKIVAWVRSIDEDMLFVSTITIGEIKNGIESLPDSRRKNDLLVWLNDGVIQRFGHRILALDTQTMLIWGGLRARTNRMGAKMALFDSLIAATALQNNLMVATRNTPDFMASGVQLINPWK